ncbi:MAG: hypothetical protein ABW078_17280 [Sedimenticola sp.]
MNNLDHSAEYKNCAYVSAEVQLALSQDALTNIQQDFLIQSAKYLGLDSTEVNKITGLEMVDRYLSAVKPVGNCRVM